jgi:N-acetyl-gamma-glutamyl-phosphate reductase
MINVSVVGATGYAGEELVRLLSHHGKVKIAHIVSKSFAGKRMSEVYPSVASNDLPLEDVDAQRLSADSDVVFLCLPHGASASIAPSLLENGIRVIDLSADFRYRDAAVYEAWYPVLHPAKALLSESVYGLPELYREEIAKSRIVGNPGCYTTCAILALAPLLKAGVVEPDGIIIDAKSGVTGAGRKEALEYAFCEVEGNVKAYGVGTHRHTSEIEQELSLAAGRELVISFTPQLLPVKRGIIATMYATPMAGVSAGDIRAAYAMYEGEPFVRVYGKGLPELKHVVGSNSFAVGFVLDERANRLVVVACLDNLIKGAAGQAVQNMNILAGFGETEGLSDMGWYL